MEDDDDAAAVLLALDKVEKQWKEGLVSASSRIDAVGSSSAGADALPRLTALAQESLARLRSLIADMEVLVRQHPREDEALSYEELLQQWKDQLESLRSSLRKANVRAKLNIQSSVKEERKMLLSGGSEATLRRRNLETRAGMASAAASVTETLRRTRQLMAQELERGSAILETLDHSNRTMRRTEGEYVGQKSLLGTSRKLLNTMQDQEMVDRTIVVAGIFFFLSVCLYILQKRLVSGLLPWFQMSLWRHFASIRPFRCTLASGRSIAASPATGTKTGRKTSRSALGDLDKSLCQR